jgi:ketosteroid isomerase-like protein
MSEANVEIVRRSLEDFAVTEELVPAVAKDLVWDMSTFRGWPDEPRYHGWDEFYEFFAAWREPYADWSLTVDNLLDPGGDHVLALVTQRGKPHGSDSDVQLEFGAVYTVRDGLIRQVQIFSEQADALQAVGLAG